MDAFCCPEVEEVVCLKSKRIGWTKIIGHVLGYHIHQDPSSVLIVQPTIADAEGYSKEEIQPTIDETDVLRELVGTSKSRSSSNTITKKKYPGGMLHLIGANSPAGFRRITVRLVLFDEVDGYPPTAGVEGDQIKLGMGRAETFWNRKYGIGSTPTVKGLSRIEKHWDGSSKGYPFLTCPHCGGEHIRRFKPPEEPVVIREEPASVSHLQWDEGDPSTAAWVCPHCGALIDYSHHRHMLYGLRWRGEHWEWTERDGFSFLPGFSGRIGFSIWAGYSMSPNATPARIAQEYEEAKPRQEDMIVFKNTVLGETWEDEGEQLRSGVLYDRREAYAADVPGGVAFLSAGIDVQGNRWEMEVVGWGRGEESWSIDYQIIIGDPSQDNDWWELLRPYLLETYRHESGAKMPIGAIGIDHGFLSKRVQAFVKRLASPTCWAFKGVPGEGRPLVESADQRKKRIRMRRSNKYRPELLGDHEAKLTTLRRLQVSQPGPGYAHFPMDRDQNWFEQLTAEKLVTRYRGMQAYREWVKLQERNEALDCRKMAYAAMLLAAPNLDRKLARQQSTEKPRETAKGKRQQPAARRGNFVSRW